MRKKVQYVSHIGGPDNKRPESSAMDPSTLVARRTFPPTMRLTIAVHGHILQQVYDGRFPSNIERHVATTLLAELSKLILA